MKTLRPHKSPTATLTRPFPPSPVPRRAVWSAALSTNGRGLQMLRTGRVSGLLPGNLHSSTPTGGVRHSQGDHHFFQLMFRPRSLSQTFQGITHKTGCPPLPPTAPRLTLRCPLASLDRTSPPPLSPTCDLPSTWAALQGQTLALVCSPSRGSDFNLLKVGMKSWVRVKPAASDFLASKS